MKPYQIRLIQEYKELYDRKQKLAAFINDLQEGRIHYEVKCPHYLFQQQLEVMNKYLDILEARAYVENIDLDTELPNIKRIPQNKQIIEKPTQYDLSQKEQIGATIFPSDMFLDNALNGYITDHDGYGEWLDEQGTEQEAVVFEFNTLKQHAHIYPFVAWHNK